MEETLSQEIRAVLRAHGRLAVDPAALEDTADLYGAGLSSQTTVDLMYALEDHFGVEFPERLMRRGAFASIAAIRAALGELREARA